MEECRNFANLNYLAIKLVVKFKFKDTNDCKDSIIDLILANYVIRDLELEKCQK